MAEDRTRKREVTALSEVMTELKLAAATIVTLNEETSIEVGAGTIAVVPVWRFMLNL
jgi:predicted AAA+ superfamily ATPase